MLCCLFDECMFVANSFILIMDIYGFPLSDDDEEEYIPPIDDNDGERENDNYVDKSNNALKYRF